MLSEGAYVSSSISPTVLRVRFAAVISEDVQSDDSLDDSLSIAAYGPVSPCAREINNEHQRSAAASSSAEDTTTISEAYDTANALENIHNNNNIAEANSPSLVSRRVRFRARTPPASPLAPRTTDTIPSTPPPAATEADTDPLVSPPQSAPGGWDSVPHTEDEEQSSNGRSALLQRIRAGQASSRGHSIVPASSPTPTTESLTYSLLDHRWTSMRSLGSGSGSGSGCTSNRGGTSSGNAEEEEEYFVAAGPVLAQDTRSQLLTRWRNSSPPFPSTSHSLPSIDNDDDDDDDDNWSLSDGDSTHTSPPLS